MTCGFSDDFTKFIKDNGYGQWGFDRPEIKCAAYGGKSSSKDKLKKTPIIFIHGNSDIGFGRGTEDGYVSWQTGFRKQAISLGAEGYTKAELYTTTWGVTDTNQAQQNNHKKKFVQFMRAFVEAVMAYTKSDKVNIIGHSMGVTLGRKVIQGGTAVDQTSGSYEVGADLSSKVKTFIGLAGANLGLTACYNLNVIPTCSNIDGFNPGALPTTGPSKFFSELNTSGKKEATNVHTIWSRSDDLILSGCVVWGKITCRINKQDSEVIK